jgi:hypothetical protein
VVVVEARADAIVAAAELGLGDGVAKTLILIT